MCTAHFLTIRRLIIGVSIGLVMFSGCAKQQEWQTLDVNETTRPVTMDWVLSGPNPTTSNLTFVDFLADGQSGWALGNTKTISNVTALRQGAKPIWTSE